MSSFFGIFDDLAVCLTKNWEKPSSLFFHPNWANNFRAQFFSSRNVAQVDTWSITNPIKNVFRLVGAIMGTPADVVKARMMNQPTDQNGRGLLYKNSFDCFTQTIKHEGFPGLYKGFFPCWFRMAPWSLTFWLSFEQIRRVFGAKSWGTWNYQPTNYNARRQ